MATVREPVLWYRHTGHAVQELGDTQLATIVVQLLFFVWKIAALNEVVINVGDKMDKFSSSKDFQDRTQQYQQSHYVEMPELSRQLAFQDQLRMNLYIMMCATCVLSWKKG